MYQRLVVPLDGSDVAERALIEAESLAALTHAPIHLVRVIDGTGDHTATPFTTMIDPLALSASLADEIDSVRHYLGSVAQRIAARGYEVSHELRHGPVVDQLIAVSKPGDLLVMASHGRSGISRWFMGSIAEDVVRRVSVPVLLVKASSYTGGGKGSRRTLADAITGETAMTATPSR